MVLTFGLGSQAARAETISSALARAYMGNPDLNQQRASTRATDENVSKANSGYRPTVQGTAQFGYARTDGTIFSQNVHSNTFPNQAGFTVTENIFNGNRTTNGVKQAESQVMQSREQTRNTEQNTLQNGATAYMNVLRDTAILELNKNNITVLEEQLRQTRDRFNVGEVTRTDVAQAESSLATARSQYFTAQANLSTSIANYRQIIGVEPHRLEAARPIDRLLPSRLEDAIVVALAEHPGIQAAFHNVDAAALQVQIAEGALYPTLNVVAGVTQANAQQGLPTYSQFQATALAQLNVPLYQGGQEYATIRQAKELLAQARLQADLQRDQIRANVVSAWGQLESSKAVIRSSEAAVKSSEIALDGVREEAKVGQRTTLDVLMAQQTLLQSRVSLVTAQRDRVVASYAVDAATGRLTAANLGLAVIEYDPTIHFDQVKDRWIGLRTPDGR
ncbi:MAG: TolC family outer membrane protein [Beijerinckiaceae bacterium]|nr:TolC family outer membrane protein [Beijerinckiaceae bacterium]